MQLTNAAPADATLTPGFEQHTMTCPECGDVEQRLVFSHRELRAEKLAEAPIEAPVETPREVPVEILLALPAESSPLSPADSAHQVDPPAARKEWAQATERLSLRRTATARELAGKAAASAEPTKLTMLATPAMELDDFDRFWDSLAAPPAPPPPSLAPPSDPVAAVPDDGELPVVSGLEASPQSPDGGVGSQPLAEPARPRTSGQGEGSPSPKLPEPSPAASSVRSGSQCSKERGALRSAWARAVAILRGKQVVGSKPDNGDAILQINAGPLK